MNASHRYFFALISLIAALGSCGEKKSIGQTAILDINVPKKPLKIETEVNLNGFNIHDSFQLDLVINKLGQPDKIVRGGQAIIDEFGVDDFDLTYGDSWVNAGHGQILAIKIADDKLKLNAIGVGNDLSQFYRCFDVHLRMTDTNMLIDQYDGSYMVIMSDDFTITSIEYYAPPL